MSHISSLRRRARQVKIPAPTAATVSCGCGWELALRSPRLHNHGPIYLTYSNQLALGCGGINGGLTDFSFGGGCGLLDHDQRNTLHIGGTHFLNPREISVQLRYRFHY